MSQKSTEQNVKDVINASSRAISKDKDLNLDVNYLQQVAEPGHNLQENVESYNFPGEMQTDKLFYKNINYLKSRLKKLVFLNWTFS